MPHRSGQASSRRATLLGLAAAACSGLWPMARAQASYPDKPLRMVVPFAAGGGTDVVGRILAHHLRGVLGQSVVVENKAGAGGVIGAQQVGGAAPDGYQLLFTSLGPLTITPNLPGMKTGFDPLKELTPVGMVARQPVLLVASAKLGVASLRELLALAKTRRLSYGTPGNGTELHLIGEMFRQVTQADLVHVPYRGGGPAITDLVAGTIDMMVVVTSSILAHVRSGAVRALATTDARRIPALPDVPTTAELGFGHVDGTASWGLLGPKGLPASVQDRLQQALKTVSADPEFLRRMGDAGVQVVSLGAADFAAHLRKESETWRQVIVAGGLRAD